MSKLKSTLVGREIKRLNVKDKLRRADEKRTLLALRQQYGDMLNREFDGVLKRFEVSLND